MTPGRRISAILVTLTVIATVLIIIGSKTQPAPPPQPAGVLGTVTKTSSCVTQNGLPDHACTPGATDTRVTQDNINSTICVSGYSASVRPPVSVTDKIKTQEMAMYGDTDSKADYELDHLISLELGGCPDCVANLWPEPYNQALGAHEKDKVENYLHKQVCSGAITLAEAQAKIANDWVSVYNSLLQ